MHVWEDDTHEVNRNEVAMSQEMWANLTELDILLRNLEFEKAIKLAFDLDLRRGFIKAMNAFCAHFDGFTDLIYEEEQED